MKFIVLTLGCKTNQAESFNIERVLFDAGYKVADISEKPDVCIINTCSVTAKADQQSRQLINKYLNNNIKVIITGCYSELYYEKIKSINPAIQIIKNEDKSNILSILQPLGTKSKEIHYHPRRRPAVKIQDGCNNACSYCVIPMTRGSSRSVAPEIIVDEIVQYETSGYKEVVLTGIHLGAYGADLNPGISLSKLLKAILSITHNIRIRLSSIEAKELDDELLEVMTEDRICKHLHIPLQSGDDKILKSMNRTYKTEDYISIINKIVTRYADIALGTDVIVGFPGESEEAYINTEQLIKKIPFSYLHVFTFSPRPSTKAAKLLKQVDEKTKKQRSIKLRNISEDMKRRFILKNIGKVKKVIVENKSAKGFIGTSEDYIKIFLPQNDNLKEGMFVTVKLKNCYSNIAIGIPLI